MKLLCVLEQNLKENNQKPQHSKTQLWWVKSKHTICSSNIPFSREIIIARKRLEQQKNKQERALNPPPHNSVTMKTLGVSSITKFLA